MNIKEERKAFNEVFAKTYPALERSAELDRNLEGLGNKETAFCGWCLAKEHAEEMAKPGCIISETMGGNYGMYKEEAHRPFNIFESQALAEQWAKENGYRVLP